MKIGWLIFFWTSFSCCPNENPCFSFGDLRVLLIVLCTCFSIVNSDFQVPHVNFFMGLCLFLLIFCLVAKKMEEKFREKEI